MSQGAYVRLLIRQKSYDFSEIQIILSVLVTEVNRIGAKICQIIEDAPSTFYSFEDMLTITGSLLELKQEMNVICEMIRKEMH